VIDAIRAILARFSSPIDKLATQTRVQSRLFWLSIFRADKIKKGGDVWDVYTKKLGLAVAECDARNAAQILDRQLLFALANDEQTITLSIDAAKMILRHVANARMPSGGSPTSLLEKIWQENSLELARQLKRKLIASGKTATDAEFDAAEFLSSRYDDWNEETARRRLQDRPENKSIP
jgi:hypothetical protein